MWTIDEAAYRAYRGEEIPAAEFPRIMARACEAVDAATDWQISAVDGPGGFSEFTARQITLAACSQAEWLWLNGIDTALDGGNAGGGYTIGRASITGGGSASGGGSRSGGLCSKAIAALAPTGLMYRGLDVLC